MPPVESTPEILLWKILNHSVDEHWVKWAVEMMIAGHETEHLVELAGICKPFNQFELKELTDRVFEELNFDLSNPDKIIQQYITFIALGVLNKGRPLLSSLRVLNRLYSELGSLEDLNDFYLLYYAKEDLTVQTQQWYWEGAYRHNIDQICYDHLKAWVEKHP